MNDFTTYPEGYSKLVKKLLPWYFPKKIKEKMMRLLLTIITDG